VRPPAWKRPLVVGIAVALALGGIGLVVAGAVTLPQGIPLILVGPVLVALGVPAAFIYAPQCLGDRIALVLRPEGVTVRSHDVSLTLPWDEVEAIGMLSSSIKLVGMRVAEPRLLAAFDAGRRDRTSVRLVVGAMAVLWMLIPGTQGRSAASGARTPSQLAGRNRQRTGYDMAWSWADRSSSAEDLLAELERFRASALARREADA